MTKKLLYISRFRMLQLTLLLLCVGYQSYALPAKSPLQVFLEMQQKRVSLAKMIASIESKGYKFAFDGNQVNINQMVNMVNVVEDINRVLDETLAGSDLGFQIRGKQIILTKKVKFKLTVKIVEEKTKVAIAGATVIIKGTNNGGISDDKGNVTINNITVGSTLDVSYTGYKTKEVKITSTLGNQVITMQEDAVAIEDIIVTGYQRLSKERATGAYATLSQKDLDKKIQTDLVSNIEGIVPGLMVNNGNISIRGISTIYGNSKPLYVVDGFPWEGDISSLSTDNIENITVLKDAAAASIYGSRSANGVIVITTKSGKVGKPLITASAKFFVTPLPSLKSDILTSGELVDLQRDFFNAYNRKYDLVKKDALPDAINFLYRHQRGLINENELSVALDQLRNSDNKSQYRDNLLQNKFKQQYNINVSGGSEFNTYYLSADYVGDREYDKGNKDRRININLKDKLSITNWLSTEIGTMISYNDQETSTVRGSSLLNTRPSYEMLLDTNSETTEWSYGKSKEEKERLQSLGLLSEHYNPIDENRYTSNNNDSFYLRFGATMNARITKGLNFSVMYQTENTSSKQMSLSGAKSYSVGRMVNDAAQVSNDKAITYNIPIGGQINEQRAKMSAYTLRSQLTFERTLDSKHSISALAGAERRKISSESTKSYRMGYDDRGLSWAMIDAKKLSSGIVGTEAVNGMYALYDYDKRNGFLAEEDRFISFYANAGYTYDSRYSVTGSVRIDESNLFGTDPKYRYAPLWSVGGSWNISNEKMMSNVNVINRLVVRATYGLNGNVSKLTGPYLIVNSGYDSNNQTSYNDIESPPNDQLRWEKTKTLNIGLDMSILKNRINFSVDYYTKNSSDLLGNVSKDPTLGWSTAIINYGSMRNKGIEVALNTVNIDKAIRWSSSLIYSNNKNKLTESANSTPSIVNYMNGEAIKDYPLNPVFSYRWAGLSDKGHPQVYNEKGEKVTGVQSIDALVYGGTLTPKFTGSFTNNISYKNLELSFMITFNGGNVIKKYISPILGTYESINNNIGRSILNRWQNPGDELKENVTPGFYPDVTYLTENLWSQNHTNIEKADHIRLRNISLSYTLPQSLLKSIKLNTIQFMFQVQNAFYWSTNSQNIDTEAQFGGNMAMGIVPYNLRPTYIFGINIKL